MPGGAVGRKALDPSEPFDNKLLKIKKAEPVDPRPSMGEIDVQVKLQTNRDAPR